MAKQFPALWTWTTTEDIGLWWLESHVIRPCRSLMFRGKLVDFGGFWLALGPTSMPIIEVVYLVAGKLDFILARLSPLQRIRMLFSSSTRSCLSCTQIWMLTEESGLVFYVSQDDPCYAIPNNASVAW